MSRIVLIENDFGALWYHPGINIVHHQYRRFTYGQVLRNVLNTGLGAIKKYGASKWLSDDKNYDAILPEDIEWAEKIWLPQMLDSGWKHWAILLPEKNLGRVNLRPIIDRYTRQGITTQTFDKDKEALAWLESV